MTTHTLPPFPPAELMFRVSGQVDADAFVASGRNTLDDYTIALTDHGHTWRDFHAIYDFGAGCGRLLRHVLPHLNGARVAASDIDAPAISWLAEQWPTVDARVNDGLPPLPFADGVFDLIFAHSVFSHLDEDRQDAWLAELRRVAAPGALVLASIHGPTNWEQTTRPALADLGIDIRTLSKRLYQYGHIWFTGDGWEQHFPDWYHSAWHHPVYVWARWSQWFDVLDIREGGARPSQDLVVLRRH